MCSPANDLKFDDNKRRRKRPKNRKVIVDPDPSRRSTLSIRLFLKEFCVQFLEHCYNPLMRSVKVRLASPEIILFQHVCVAIQAMTLKTISFSGAYLLRILYILLTKFCFIFC